MQEQTDFQQRYKIIKELGRGGMGIVYQAHDNILNRTVAIKTLLRSESDPVAIKRFQREAHTCAKLRHYNLVEIYDIGVFQGKYFFSMEHVEGITLKEFSKQQTTEKIIATIMKKICLAMDYAHQNKIIHRDLKPSNIMILKGQEPKVMDFGLAFSTNNTTKLSQTGIIMGTLAYMPPEQLEGKRRDIDSRSDIYALGAILYEFITGEPPFDGEYFIIVHNVIKGIFAKPSEVKEVPKNLEYICLKAMSIDKRDRYQTAKEMADDLDRALKGEDLAPNYIVINKKKYIERTIFWVLICFFVFMGVTLGKQNKHRVRKNTVEIPQKIWSVCWQEENEWFDFTTKTWAQLELSLQQKYMSMYQQWYAHHINEEIEKTILIENVPIKMVLIPPGLFHKKNQDEHYQVGLYRPFYISQQVISSQFTNSNTNWEAANSFCKSIHANLPTESQWEYAMQGGLMPDHKLFAWGCEKKNIDEWCFDYAETENYGVNDQHTLTVIPKYDSHIEPISFPDTSHNYREHIVRNTIDLHKRQTKNNNEQANVSFRIVLHTKHIPQVFPKPVYTQKTIAKMWAKPVNNNVLENDGFIYQLPNAGLTLDFGFPKRLAFNSATPFEVQFNLASIPDKLIISNFWETTCGGGIGTTFRISINNKVFLPSLVTLECEHSWYKWEIATKFLNEGINKLRIENRNGKLVWLYNLEVVAYEKP